MNSLEEEVRQLSAMELTLEYNRLLFLIEYNELPSISLAAAKKLLYVEEELNNRRDKLLPGLPKPEPPKEEEPEDANYMNVILGSYYKRKLKPKVEPEAQLRFFVKVKNSLNATVASIPVMASSKGEAIVTAKEKCKQKFGNKKLKFEVS